MAVNWETLDYSNPAALLAVLRPAYYRLIAGATVASVDVPVGNGATIRTSYSQGDVKALGAVVTRLEESVSAKTNPRGGRRAFIAG